MSTKFFTNKKENSLFDKFKGVFEFQKNVCERGESLKRFKSGCVPSLRPRARARHRPRNPDRCRKSSHFLELKDGGRPSR